MIMIFFMNMNIIITDYAQEQRPEKWQTNAVIIMMMNMTNMTNNSSDPKGKLAAMMKSICL